jgi:hypothetical protein
VGDVTIVGRNLLVAVIGAVVAGAGVLGASLVNSYWFDVPAVIGGGAAGICGAQAFFAWRDAAAYRRLPSRLAPPATSSAGKRPSR